MKIFEGVCDKCEKKEYCKDYQESLKDSEKILFGCSYEIKEDRK